MAGVDGSGGGEGSEMAGGDGGGEGSEMAGGDGSGGGEGSEIAGGDGSGGGEGSEMAGGDGGGEGSEEATDLQMALLQFIFLGGSNSTHACSNYLICMRFIRISMV